MLFTLIHNKKYIYTVTITSYLITGNNNFAIIIISTAVANNVVIAAIGLVCLRANTV